MPVLQTTQTTNVRVIVTFPRKERLHIVSSNRQKLTPPVVPSSAVGTVTSNRMGTLVHHMPTSVALKTNSLLSTPLISVIRRKTEKTQRSVRTSVVVMTNLLASEATHVVFEVTELLLFHLFCLILFMSLNFFCCLSL